ncbi:SCO7613 C-terminal domain-containing membrane protein [Agromyces sp. NPDC056379]|uniref:SCO7613 C-terminal domain-containing membrane protein n=1 Tax=unclassified Agromyces TaxID=2639701 RepID=UPI0035D996B8
MVSAWNEQAARYLLASTNCPRCDAQLGDRAICPECAADLRGAEGRELWEASQRAAEAVHERARLIAALPTASWADRTATSAAGRQQARADPAPAVSAASAPQPDASTSTSTSQVSVQSVLAVAGAGLFAVAAIVFTFLNPDVGFAMRTTVIAVVTVIFLATAWMLRRRGVQFSAEAIGALGMVFLALDVWAFTELAPAEVSGWAFAALGTAIAAAAMLAIAWRARIRTWWWIALVGLAFVPAFLGYAAGGWGTAWGHLGVIGVALGAQQLLRVAAPRFGAELRTDRLTLTVVQLLATVVVLVQLVFLPAANTQGPVLVRAAILALLAALAAVATRYGIPRSWSFIAGALGTAALVAASFAPSTLDPVWQTALMPLAGAVAIGASGAIRPGGVVRAREVQSGALAVGLAVALPAVSIALGALGSVVLAFLGDGLAPFRSPGSDPIVPVGAGGPAPDQVLAAVLGLLAAASGAAVLAALARRTEPAAHRTSFPIDMLVLALWTGALGTAAFVGWPAFTPLGGALVGIAAAVLATAMVIVPISRFSRARLSVRVPFIVLAHAALVVAALLSWNDPNITVPVGVVIVAAILVVVRPIAPGARVVHVGAAYAYALVVFATALDRLGVVTIAVLCLTTTAAALCALAATLVRRVDARSWYAILVVTAVPFLIGVATVLREPNGWTALSTAVMFLLALALVLTRRPGLNRLVRSAAAALLVPSLAVVAVCLGSQFLDVSGSPVVLPVIAAIVAVVLPATKAIGAVLVRHGHDAATAASVRLWIEISSLVTAAIAVLLALVRDAAGLGTAMAVLVVLGLGFAATRIVAGRRYGWWLAAASWTGALWCVWAMLGIMVVEPYTLPPAIAAIVVGAILVARGRRGLALAATGLACALVPSLVLLAAWGSEPGAFPWRTATLLAASVVLLVSGRVLTRLPAGSDTRMLRTPALAGALVAAAAAPIQAMRWGLERDVVAIADPDLVMLPVLGISVVGVLLAIASVRRLHDGAPKPPAAETPLEIWLRETRWLLAPALVFLVAGPVTAIRREWFAIWTLWVLMVLLLALALVTVSLARRARPVLPPFWFTYGLAWATGVTGWSERDLRVEVFSLPLGLAVLAAGLIAMRPAAAAPSHPSLNSWPIGFRGSWRLLAPGIVLTFLPSVLATGTDPQLYRPILVIALALVAILVGSSRKLAAPFVLGLAVLPIENIVVFSAQVDRAVGAMPWWITLATAGAVLLAIAVGSERRTNQGGGVAARLRELE